MTDAVIASLIGLCGALVGGGIALLGQLAVTRQLIKAESARVLLQIRTEAALRAEERRREQLREQMAELMAVSDVLRPQRYDLPRAIALVNIAQFTLGREGAELALNGALNRLARAIDRSDGPDVQEALRARSDISDALPLVLRIPLPS